MPVPTSWSRPARRLAAAGTDGSRRPAAAPDDNGRARSELLPLMYSPQVLAAFVRFRRLWDPEGMLSPGIMTEPDRTCPLLG